MSDTDSDTANRSSFENDNLKRERKLPDRYDPATEEKEGGKKKKMMKYYEGETLHKFMLRRYFSNIDGIFRCNKCGKLLSLNTSVWCRHIVTSCTNVTMEEKLELARKSNVREIKLWLKNNERINDGEIANSR